MEGASSGRTKRARGCSRKEAKDAKRNIPLSYQKDTGQNSVSLCALGDLARKKKF
jgi:hypothetical protein